eukprot:CAMPEP_0180785340 /NCGR_PEP_ID=MMETSP1038_2-20121128/50135_1 /TAXON_ID=632150 /ORGANISM="Azadinium spinosum, Strain 3D9" /LENGTH=41 /DNA_ID= /DNA_START= /DNA_END= /DNA_ORIENTATION=
MSEAGGRGAPDRWTGRGKGSRLHVIFALLLVEFALLLGSGV